jgi:predicted AAA+ superfamily ATPase
MITRKIENQIFNSLKPSLVVGLFGARRTGKTVLMNIIKEQLSKNSILMVQGDNLDVTEILSSQRISILKRFVLGYDYLFIDEAQKIPNIGQNLKLLVDSTPELKIFITGSSALELRNKIGEPLTGRSKYFHLYPISYEELDEEYLTYKEKLEEKLIYGSYPLIVTSDNIREKTDALESIKNGYLLKDILELDNQKDSSFILKLLRLIAFQIGNDVSYAEIASKLNVNGKTVQRYLDILEKTYIIFSLTGFSRNLRKEYSKTPRYYFWDNGIRNSLISNYNSIAMRDDTGKLWENYCISERLKAASNNGLTVNYYFWRTYDQQEIDLIEEISGELNAYEFKFSSTKKKNIPSAFKNTYPKAKFKVVNPENFYEFI